MFPDAPDVLRRFHLIDPGDGVPGAAVGSSPRRANGPPLAARSPIDGRNLATVRTASPGDVGAVIDSAEGAFKTWRLVPAPRRGEFVRRIGEKLRERKADLAALVTLEAGKIMQEALGEVQEMIDICDFAVGLSRQLYGLTIASERPGHRMMEQWHPLGPVGVITAFNFPVAVWAWNAMLALVCGDAVVWKPSEKTPLTALACHELAAEVMARDARGARRRPRRRGRRRPRRRHSAGRFREAAADLRDRLGANGPGGGDDRRRAAGPLPAGTGRQQRHDPRPLGRPGTGRRAPSSSPPPAPAASAARRCAG